ncbi:unnamed protein product [Protopolystoma xenopodis]|uniref:Uncharacterized protein n=1 Tax=Protopolystoma xenopodis TaxID=117903 RepID=A0A448WLD8_9PLAT|nr:unnamed protein product [Protopolystoma xenopodis]
MKPVFVNFSSFKLLGLDETSLPVDSSSQSKATCKPCPPDAQYLATNEVRSADGLGQFLQSSPKFISNLEHLISPGQRIAIGEQTLSLPVVGHCLLEEPKMVANVGVIGDADDDYLFSMDDLFDQLDGELFVCLNDPGRLAGRPANPRLAMVRRTRADCEEVWREFLTSRSVAQTKSTLFSLSMLIFFRPIIFLAPAFSQVALQFGFMCEILPRVMIFTDPQETLSLSDY